MNDTIASLENYITTTILKQPNRKITPDEPLISSGLIDLFSLMDLALFVEDTFGVRIEDTELNADTFDNLTQLASLVESRNIMPTFPERLKTLHSQDPELVAVYLQFSGRDDLPITRGQLMLGASSYAENLSLNGIQPGEVVVLILQHGEDLLYAFWGAILHGAIPSIMPFLTEKLSPERYRADLSALILVTQPAAIVTYPEFESNVRAALKDGRFCPLGHCHEYY